MTKLYTSIKFNRITQAKLLLVLVIVVYLVGILTIDMSTIDIHSLTSCAGYAGQF